MATLQVEDPARERVSAEEYLRREREADQPHKSEYRNGYIVPTPGASRHHVRIVTNIVAEFREQFYDTDCLVFSTDLRVHVEDPDEPDEELFTYPDVGVVCDEPQFLGGQNDTLLNPALLIEVLSKSTRDYDRGQKFAHYAPSRRCATTCSSTSSACTPNTSRSNATAAGCSTRRATPALRSRSPR